MAAAEPIINALTQAAPRLSEPEIRAAYEQLIRIIESYVMGQPFLEDEVQPLTETQLVFLRHGLRGIDPSARGQTAWLEMQQAADSLSKVVEQNTSISVGQQVINTIQTVQGGTVVMNGIVNHQAAPERSELLDSDDLSLPEPLPRPKRQHDIFLSYSRKDARIMRRLYADLAASGFTVWTDDDLTPGTPSWMTAIENAIQASGCVVVLLTPESKKSRWVERELTSASNYDLSIFPLLARGDERSSIPLLLSSHQWSDIRKERDYRMSVRKLIRGIRAELSKLKDD
jgi:hypothetical protein